MQLRRQPAAGFERVTKSVQADWQGELRFELASGSGGASAADGKPGAEAFKPTELVLAALAS